MTSEQLATVLAALRYWQADLHMGHPLAGRRDIMDIATNIGEFDEPDEFYIDGLCEELNCGPDPISVTDLPPGPWVAKSGAIFDAKGNCIALCETDVAQPAEPRAHVMAAALEMRRVLEEIGERYSLAEDTHHKIDEVIVKAGGVS